MLQGDRDVVAIIFDADTMQIILCQTRCLGSESVVCPKAMQQGTGQTKSSNKSHLPAPQIV